MKRLLVVLLVLATAVPATAANVAEGMFEARVDASYNFEKARERLYFPLLAGVGCYVADGVVVGGLMTFEKRNWESGWGVGEVWALGAFAEYNFDLTDVVVPTIGISARVFDSDEERDWVLTGALSPGVKLFVSESVSVALQLHFNAATKEVYGFERKSEEEGSGSRVGVAFSTGVRVAY